MGDITAVESSMTEITSESFPENVRKIAAPFPGDNPCGEDPKYIAEFDTTKSEIEKISGIDFDIIFNNCRSILENKAKDLRVLGYFIIASAKVEGITSFCRSVKVYAYLMEKYWEGIYPEREIARANAFRWLNQEKITAWMEQLVPSIGDGEELASCLKSLESIKDFINSHFTDNPPSIGNLVKLVSKWSSSFPAAFTSINSPIEQDKPISNEAVVSAAEAEPTPPDSASSERQSNDSVPEETKPESTELSDLTKILIAPISPDNFYGDDPKYSTEFDAAKNEIEKNSGIDYEKVYSNCLEVITRQAKDLRALGFLLLAGVKTDGLKVFREIIQAYQILICDHLEGLHPQRESARLNAIKWLNQEKFQVFLGQIEINSNNFKDVSVIKSCLSRLKDKLNSDFGGSAPSIGGLIKLVDEWYKKSKPAPEPEKPSPVASSASAQTVSASSAPAVSVPSADVADISGAQIALQKTAQFYLKNNPANPIGYKLMRVLKWQEIVKAPNAPDGVLKIQGPNPIQVEYYLNSVKEQKWSEVLNKGEEAFTRPGLHFWLDLQYYVYQALIGIGSDYHVCAEVIVGELLSLVSRVPELMNIKYQNGIPFVGPLAIDWIQEEMGKRGNGGGGISSGSGDEKFEEDKTKAMKLVSEGRFEDALTLIEQGIGPGNAKKTAQRKLLMARISFQTGNTDLAEGILEGITSTISMGSIDSWDPDFCFSVYHLGIQIFSSLSERKKNSNEQKNLFLTKTRENFLKLGKLNPVEANRINFY